MSEDFETIYEEPSPCCNEYLEWEWNNDFLHFEGECACMKRYILTPITALLEKDSEDIEYHDD